MCRTQIIIRMANLLLVYVKKICKQNYFKEKTINGCFIEVKCDSSNYLYNFTNKKNSWFSRICISQHGKIDIFSYFLLFKYEIDPGGIKDRAEIKLYLMYYKNIYSHIIKTKPMKRGKKKKFFGSLLMKH
jgi:hypothetical protein